jgi:hypothetical protein
VHCDRIDGLINSAGGAWPIRPNDECRRDRSASLAAGCTQQYSKGRWAQPRGTWPAGIPDAVGLRSRMLSLPGTNGP